MSSVRSVQGWNYGMTIVADRLSPPSPVQCLGNGVPAKDGAVGRRHRSITHVCRKCWVDGTSGKANHPGAPLRTT